MLIFETILALLLGATFISVFARRVGVPYPTLLALGGALVALVPGAPRLDLPPELLLALFVAPVLLDAAYDASLRDLKDNWAPVTSLVLVAVGVTTLSVAFAARLLFPDMPWAAAVALGAVVAPPDAVAALAVMREVKPPHRIRKVLEGESLLNDASALLIYRLAVGAAAGGFSVTEAAPTFALVAVGSVAVGWLLTWPTGLLISRIDDVPSSVILQFVLTFGVWIIAERLHLSGVITVVVFGLVAAQRTSRPMAARMRVPSFAVWETVTVVLNVLAFTLIGLQVGPILGALSPDDRIRYLVGALAILAVVILVRLAWVMTYNGLVRAKNRLIGVHVARSSMSPPTVQSGLVIGWSGMRGIVTLAAALALPESFPYRDFIELAAFGVVLGTLLLQGLTLRPLLAGLKMREDDPVEAELRLARTEALKATMAVLQADGGPEAAILRQEYETALRQVEAGANPRASTENALRRRAVEASRRAILKLRKDGTIGEDAYRRLEEEFDWLELSAREA